MYPDQRGLALTTDSADAVRHFDAAIRHYLEYRLATADDVKHALEADPNFVMGHCLAGCLLMTFQTLATRDRVLSHLTAARAGLPHVSPREARHVAALEAWYGGNTRQVARILEQIVIDHPTDLLALRLHHFNSFWLGDSQGLRSLPACALGAWESSMPGFGNVLSMLAFGYEECGDYVTAERLGRQAFEISPDDLWAVHAVAHVLEMQGRLGEGMAWLDRAPDAWADRNPFKDHLWWHAALFPLERGDYEKVLALYDRSIRVDANGFYLDVQNAASLLLRLQLLDVDVGERWQELADLAEARIGDHVLPFTDLHFMMALAASGRHDAAARLLASLRGFSETSPSDAATTMKSVGLQLSEAIVALVEGDYGAVVDRLAPIRRALADVGASHSQRDIFNLMLIEAALRGGRASLARALLSERVTLRPCSLGNWTRYAAALDATGDRRAAAAARQHRDELLAV